MARSAKSRRCTCATTGPCPIRATRTIPTIRAIPPRPPRSTVARHKPMNPLTNRWAALFAVAIILLGVAELVGTGEGDGVLSRYSSSAEDAPPPGGAPIEVIEQPASAPPEVIEDEPEIIDADEDGESTDE